MIQTNNKNILLRCCANCNCFGHPNPNSLWGTCPQTLGDKQLYQPIAKVGPSQWNLKPVWLTDHLNGKGLRTFHGKDLTEMPGKSILDYFRDHLAWCLIMKRVRHKEFNNEEQYFVDALLEYYAFVNELTNQDITIDAGLYGKMEYAEYDMLYKYTIWAAKSLRPLDYKEHISYDYYKKRADIYKDSFNPFIWFHRKSQGVLISKNIPPNQFILPDIPEFECLKPIIDGELLISMLQIKSTQDLNKLLEFKWTHPLTAEVWDLSQTPGIYPETKTYMETENYLKTLNIEETRQIYNSLPEDYGYMYRDLYLKNVLSPIIFYNRHRKILAKLPHILIPLRLIIDVTKDQKTTEAIWTRHLENHAKKK